MVALHSTAQFHLQLVRIGKEIRPGSAYFLKILFVFISVYLALRNQFIANNTQINIKSIGQYSDKPNGALQCITDRKPCCFSPIARYGEWYLPNGTTVPRQGNGSESDLEFYRNRGDNGRVYLNRPTNNSITALTPTGQFCCEVPDATGINQILCVLIGKLCLIIIMLK